MADKNKKPPVTEAAALEAKVDAMMDPTVPDKSMGGVPAQSKSGDPTPPPLNIFASAPSAPELPKAGQSKVNAPEKTLVINESSNPEPTLSSQPALKDGVLDDATSDKAIDDIVAHESDTILAAEDAELAASAQETEPEEPVEHHYYIFWSFITIIALIAIAIAILLVSPDNQFPGGQTVHNWWQSLQAKI